MLTVSQKIKVIVTLSVFAVAMLSGNALLIAQDNPFGGTTGGSQDNPFGGSASGGQSPFGGSGSANNPFGTQQSDTAGDNSAVGGTAVEPDQGEFRKLDRSVPKTTRLIIESIRSSNPRTAIDVAKAARTLIDIDQIDDAKIYLSRLNKLSPNDQQMFELEQVVGADFFMSLFSDDRLQPEGREIARAVFAGSRRAATSPDRIAGLISGLSNENISLRSEAFQALRRIGPSATAEMINVFADPARVSEYPYIRGALQNMGDSAVLPLVGAAHSDDFQVQLEAVRALQSYPSGEAADAMIRVYMSTRIPEAVRRLALDSMLNQYEFTRQKDVAIDRLYTRAKEYLSGAKTIRGDHTTEVEMWNWNSTAKKLERLIVPKSTAEQMMAAERARDLVEIDPSSRRNRQLYLLTELESLKRQKGPNVKVRVEELTPVLGEIYADDVASALRDALEMNHIAAAVGACELLEQVGNFQQVQASGSQPGILLQAMLTGDRHLQFAAFEAIAAIDPQTAYTGNSYMTSLAVYLASTQGSGSVLVGHSRIALAQTYATSLGPSGLYPVVAETGRELVKHAIANPDIEAIFITDSMSRPDYIELAQQLRSDWRLLRTPICMLVQDERSNNRVLQVLSGDPYLLALPATFDSSAMAVHMSQLRRLTQPWQVSQAQRRIHADSAVKWLSRIANDRVKYGFYELGGHEATLLAMLYTPNAALSSGVLAGLGTPSAQRELVNFASQNGIALQDRKAAAAAFAKSVAASGLMLTTAEVQLQFDRYNASEFQSTDSQQILGGILDAIESNSRRNQASPSR